MELGDRLGFAGLIAGIFGLGITILWPTRRWIGYACLVVAVVLAAFWGFSEYHAHTQNPVGPGPSSTASVGKQPPPPPANPSSAVSTSSKPQGLTPATKPLLSPLKLTAFPVGRYGAPNQSYFTMDVNIENSGDDAINNLEVTLQAKSHEGLSGISQTTTDAAPCQIGPTFPGEDMRMTFRAKDQKGKITIDSTDAFVQSGVSSFWGITCSRISGHSELRFQLSKWGTVNDAVNIYGTYELIASKGSGVVKVSLTSPIEH